MNTRPLISVIITTYNRPNHVINAINSVINQTYRNIEIIVIDDNSTLENFNILTSLMKKLDFDIIVIRNTENKGACFSRNEGIRAAKGVYICGLDDDDEFTPDRIWKLFEFYQSFKEPPSLVCSYSKIINLTTGKILNEKHTNSRITLSTILKTNKVGAQVLVTKENLINSGLFDEKLPASQDHDMWVRIIEKYGDAFKLNEILYISYVDENIDRVSKKRVSGLILFIKKHKNKMNFYQYIFNILRLIKMKLKSF